MKGSKVLSSVYLFFAIITIATWGIAGLAMALQEQLKQMVGLVFIPAAIVPIILAYVMQRRDGGGGPFAGLVWGPTSLYFLTALLGLGWGSFVLFAQIVAGLAGLDTTMSFYAQTVMDMAAEMGQPMPAEAASAISIQGWATFGISLLFGPWFGAAFGCLGSFPLLGYALRRLLVLGRGPALALLMGYGAVSGAAAGLIENPNLGDADMPLRIALMAAYGLAGLPAMSWLFIRTRSAVLPALLTASYSSALAAATPFLSDYAPWLSSSGGGLLTSAGSLLLGIALWLWQDPGDSEALTVAAVAQDGTLLTPRMLEAQQQSAGSAEMKPA